MDTLEKFVYRGVAVHQFVWAAFFFAAPFTHREDFVPTPGWGVKCGITALVLAATGVGALWLRPKR